MNPSDLPYAGPTHNDLRQKIAYAIGQANAHSTHYLSDLGSLFQEAADAVDAGGVKPSELPYAGPSHNDLRQRISYSIGQAWAHNSSHSQDLKDLLQAAADALDGEGGGGTGTPPSIQLVPILSSGAFASPAPGSDIYTNEPNLPWSMITTQGDEPITFGYKWYRVNPDNTQDRTEIPGETQNSYIVRTEDIGFLIGVEVTATNNAGSDSYFTWVEISVIDPELAPNAPVGGTAVAAAEPGDIDVTITPGEQIPGHPDTQYELYVYNDDNSVYDWVIINGTSSNITGLAPGTYNVRVEAVINDITWRYINPGVLIGSSIVVT